MPRDAQSPEGQGVLMATVFQSAEQRSDLIVLDAQNVADGPLATVRLDHRIPMGFHGNWRSA